MLISCTALGPTFLSFFFTQSNTGWKVIINRHLQGLASIYDDVIKLSVGLNTVCDDVISTCGGGDFLKYLFSTCFISC